MSKQRKHSYPSGMLSALQALASPGFARFTKRAFSRAMSRHPGKEDIVSSLFESSVTSLLTLKQKKSPKLTTYTHESHQKSNQMILSDKLSSYENGQPTKALSTLLLKILARELISREKASKPFWTDAYKAVSETLPLPTVIECQDSGSNSLNPSLPRRVEPSPSLMIQEISHRNKNSRKTFSRSSISTHVDKWVSGHTQTEPSGLKTLTIQFYPTPEQKIKLDRELQVSNYVYNKTVAVINARQQKINKLALRDQLVTADSRKSNVLFSKISSAKAKIEKIVNELKKTHSLKSVVRAVMIKRKWWRVVKFWYDHVKENCPPVSNDSLKSFEKDVHKDIRAGSVFEAHKNYLNCLEALNVGRIKYFELKYRKKKECRMSMVITKKMLRLENGTLRFTDSSLTDKTIHVANRTRKALRGIPELKDAKITKQHGVYNLRIPIATNPEPTETISRVIGIDPGVSTFLSGYTPDKSVIIKQSDAYAKVVKVRDNIKSLRRQRLRKRIRKKVMIKLERRQANVINELHWQAINYLVKNYDLIFLEKFESQGCVKGSKKKALNRKINDLKPYQFRQRLEYKAGVCGKLVHIVDAHNTTKTCSNCGNVQHMSLSDRVYSCKKCECILDRDLNAGKNVLLKGLLY